MKAIIQLVRPINLGLLAFSLLGFVLLGLQTSPPNLSGEPNWVVLILLFVYLVSSVTASGYIVNDLYDIRADMVNKPNAMVIGKMILPSYGLRIYAAFLFDGLFFSILLYWLSEKQWVTAIVFATQVLLFVYAKYLKGTVLWGNLLVSILVVAPYWFALYVFGFSGVLLEVALVISFCAFSINLIREVAKDIQDIRGDAFARYQTLPVKYGIKRALLVLRGTLLFSILIHTAVLFFANTQAQSLTLNNLWVWIPVFLVVFLLIYLYVRMAREFIPIDRLSRYLKIAMFLGATWPYYLLLFL